MALHECGAAAQAGCIVWPGADVAPTRARKRNPLVTPSGVAGACKRKGGQQGGCGAGVSRCAAAGRPAGEGWAPQASTVAGCTVTYCETLGCCMALSERFGADARVGLKRCKSEAKRCRAARGSRLGGSVARSMKASRKDLSRRVTGAGYAARKAYRSRARRCVPQKLAGIGAICK